jgi:hypothetical protein
MLKLVVRTREASYYRSGEVSIGIFDAIDDDDAIEQAKLISYAGGHFSVAGIGEMVDIVDLPKLSDD